MGETGSCIAIRRGPLSPLNCARYDDRDSANGPDYPLLGGEPKKAALPRPENHAMTKEIRLNAFDMNCIGHIQHGMWTHPRDRSTAYNTIEYWQDLARLAERGKFDGIFLADIVGVYDVYRGGPAPSIVDAVQIAGPWAVATDIWSIFQGAAIPL